MSVNMSECGKHVFPHSLTRLPPAFPSLPSVRGFEVPARSYVLSQSSRQGPGGKPRRRVWRNVATSGGSIPVVFVRERDASFWCGDRELALSPRGECESEDRSGLHTGGSARPGTIRRLVFVLQLVFSKNEVGCKGFPISASKSKRRPTREAPTTGMEAAMWVFRPSIHPSIIRSSVHPSSARPFVIRGRARA